MTATRLIEYTPEAAKLTGHKTLLQVSSWGNKYYIDFEEYSKYLSKYFSNMLVIVSNEKEISYYFIDSNFFNGCFCIDF